MLTRTQFDPWREMERLLSEMPRLFESPNGHYAYPKINVWTREDDLLVSAELPGLEPDSLNITIHQDRLVIEGEIPARERKEGETYHRSERSSGKFRREVQLPFRADPEATRAEMRHGVLRLCVKPVADDAPRTIKVNAG